MTALSAEFTIGEGELMAHDVPLGCAPDEYDDLISGTCSHLPKRKILDSNILIGLAGIYASYSSWMEWELDTALDNGIPVIGVVPRGAQRISTMVSTRAVEIVRWNTESIIAAIRLHAR
nr:TIR domain-containing protein [Escherichia coli]